MVREGLKLEPRLLALGCSSHSGSEEHLTAVREILSMAKLDESALQALRAALAEALTHGKGVVQVLSDIGSLRDAIDAGMAPALAIMLDESLFEQVQRISPDFHKTAPIVAFENAGKPSVLSVRNEMAREVLEPWYMLDAELYQRAKSIVARQPG